jgi:hypothetical protein
MLDRFEVVADQGAEMAQHEKLTSETGIDVYFCDPQSLLSADCFAIACRAVRGNAAATKTPMACCANTS